MIPIIRIEKENTKSVLFFSKNKKLKAIDVSKEGRDKTFLFKISFSCDIILIKDRKCIMC